MEFTRGSSSYTRLQVHVTFKVKYCHKIFLYTKLREECRQLFYQIAEEQGVVIDEMGFDEDHVHMIWRIRVTQSLDNLAKAFKGTTGRKLLDAHPFIKKKYFWKSGMWSGVIYGDTIGRNYDKISNYVKLQKLERQSVLEFRQSIA